MPSPTIYLHIGSPRTGTTSIQKLLRWNRQELSTRGVLFPYSTGEMNSRHILTHATERSSPNEHLHFPYLSEERLRAWLAPALAAEIAQFQPHTVILSDEQLVSRVTTIQQVSRVRNLLDPLGKVKIVCYLRRQDEFLLSGWAYGVQKGNRDQINKLPIPDDIPAWLNYSKTLDAWKKVYGPDAIILRRYERDRFPEGDIVKDFAQAIGLDREGLRETPAANTSDSGPMLEWRRRFSARISSVTTGIPVVAARLPYRNIPASRKRVIDLFRESNRQIARDYLKSDEDLFSEDPGKETSYSVTVDNVLEFATIALAPMLVTPRMHQDAAQTYGMLKAAHAAKEYSKAADLARQLLELGGFAHLVSADALRLRLAGCLLKCKSRLGATIALAGLVRDPEATLKGLADAAERLHALGEDRIAKEAYGLIAERSVPAEQYARLKTFAEAYDAKHAGEWEEEMAQAGAERLLELALGHLQTQSLPQAVRHFEVLVDRFGDDHGIPGASRIRMRYGGALSKLGRRQEASIQYKRAIELDDISGDNLLRCAVALREVGEEVAADQAFQAALQKGAIQPA